MVWAKDRGSFLFICLANGHPIAPEKSICWKDHPFHIELPWHICRKSIDPVYVDIFLDFLLHSNCYMFQWCSHGADVYFTQISHSPNYCSLIKSLKIRQCKTSKLFFFFKVVLANKDALYYIYNLESVCQFLNKKLAGTLSWIESII